MGESWVAVGPDPRPLSLARTQPPLVVLLPAFVGHLSGVCHLYVCWREGMRKPLFARTRKSRTDCPYSANAAHHGNYPTPMGLDKKNNMIF